MFDHTIRDSMLELEQALEEETRDISSRFQSERRPEPAGLDRALSDNYTTNRPQHGSRDGFAQHKYASKHGGFVTGFDPLSKAEQAKKASRAQRFGAVPQSEIANRDETMDEQGTSMDIDEREWVRPDNLPMTPPRTSTIRLEAVHLYGTDEMSTKDVLKYFEAYGPSHVEWIDDSSCNIIFPDQFSAKRALYFQLVDRNVNFGEDDDVEPTRTETLSAEGADTVEASVMVPGSKNRLQRAKDYTPIQQQHQPVIPNNKGLFIRYATDYDRKERGAAAKSNYYAVYGREESRTGTGRNNSGSSSMGSSRYGRRSRADEDEVWNRGRGILSMSSLRRKMEGAGSPSPSPTRHRSWSRNRRLAGSRSRSRSSGPRSTSRGRSSSPGYSSRRDRASRSPDSGSRMRTDDYENRGRRGDISLRLGGRVKVSDEEASIAAAAAESRLNQYTDDFLAELESTFSRREKAIPKTKLYSDFYEREIVTEVPTESQTNAAGHGRRENREGRREPSGRSDDHWASASTGRGRRGDHRKERGRDREEALKALDARLGMPTEERVDEFGRSRRD
ncbi:hypothetical protein BC939DRAFT_455977 [Gamsiella multidivaricata]|uniref:uncharacterized protein n=1 Tax=Gamsiella multidivaricata TaxID=101098 RepID=UPI0022209262|nr:uncharacterized protein BC939DRAFT_455977 [Gamsiella multidivaricata]KAI7821165.1 hypothetical protein BC939DRAFT_455977 [Gamsiella multidivaricata]